MKSPAKRAGPRVAASCRSIVFVFGKRRKLVLQKIKDFFVSFENEGPRSDIDAVKRPDFRSADSDDAASADTPFGFDQGMAVFVEIPKRFFQFYFNEHLYSPALRLPSLHMEVN